MANKRTRHRSGPPRTDLPELPPLANLLPTRFQAHLPPDRLVESTWIESDDPAPLESPGPCFVYLARHVPGKRFKVGISVHPAVRLGSMDRQFDRISENHSLQAMFPSTRRAKEVEGGLHRILAPWHLRFDERRDGYTEWFNEECWSLAVTVLGLARATVSVDQAAPTEVPSSEGIGADLRRLLHRIHEVASNRHVEILRDKRSHFEGFCVVGLRHDLQPPMHRLRYAVMDPASYQLQLPGKRGPRSLLRGHIDWDGTHPANLVVPIEQAERLALRGPLGSLLAGWVRAIEQALVAGQHGWRLDTRDDDDLGPLT